MATESMTFDFIARDRTQRTFNRVADGAKRTESALKRTGKAFAVVGRWAKIGLGVGLVAGAAGMRVFTAEARESNQVSRITIARLKSTRGAAKVTAKQISDLATAISNKTGIDDEQIQSTENMLLTFTRVRNEVGKGNAIFDRATQAATDMAAAFGGNSTRAAVQLGKALSDPIKGITGLTRAGVVFTQKQKDTIKSLVEQGRTLDAQKIILRELNKEFGGTAVAASDPMQRLGVVLHNVAETIGLALLPFLEKASGFLADHLPGAVATAQAKVTEFIDKVRPIARAVTDAFTTAKDSVQRAFDKFQPDLSALVENIRTKFRQVGGSLIAAINVGLSTGDWSTLGSVIGQGLYTALTTAGGVAARVGQAFASVDWAHVGTVASKAAAPFLVSFVSSFLGDLLTYLVAHPIDAAKLALAIIPVGRIAKVLEPLLGRLPILGGVLRALTKAGSGVEGAAKRLIVRPIVRAFDFIFPGIRSSIARAVDGAILRALYAADRVKAVAQRLVGRLVGAIAAGATRVVVGIKLLIRDMLRPFERLGSALFGAGRALVQGFINGIKSLAGSAYGAAKDMAQRAVDAAKSLLHIHSPSRVFFEIGGFVGEGFRRGIEAGGKKAQNAINTLIGSVSTRLKSVRDAANSLRSSVADSVRGLLDVSNLGGGGGNVAATLGSLAAKARKFAGYLATLARRHVAPALIAAIAQAGPDAGMAAASSLATASNAQIASSNRSYADLNRYANAAGTTAANASYGAAIKELTHEVKVLQRALAGYRSGDVEFRVRNDRLFIRWVSEKQHSRRRNH